MGTFWAKKLVFVALPLGVRWIRRQEQRVLSEGRALSEWETRWAKEVGVDRPDEVRVLPVERVPTPGFFLSRILAFISRVRLDSPTGMAVNYGIFLDASQKSNPSLLVHELVHVAQYERLGGIRGFLEEYLIQCVRDGYWNSVLEQEARDAAAPFNRPPGGG